ncbi:butyrophilin-like protein 1 [Pontoporia blainvillei]|uniref:Butyrophilin-like protein 1 n=1 Tax=Pontoporia blainvillei TaxID=48723 RepID=A0ABX0S815_PONBL|nr:butyrophilin-like protein 1 [Pontoporia blainvillei]
MQGEGLPLELYTRRHCWGPQDPGGPPGLYILPPAGVGSAPQVRITGPEEDGVRVVCTASGWFPKPQVQWRDLSGEKFLAFSEAHSQDAEGLFSMEVALVVRDSSAGNVTCSVLNPVLGQEKAMAIFIPVSLTVLMALLLGAGYYTMREHFRKLQVMREKENLRQVKEQDRWTKEKVLKDTEELRTELDTAVWTPSLGWKWRLLGGRTQLQGLSQVWAADSHAVLGSLGVTVTPGSIMHPGSYSSLD